MLDFLYTYFRYLSDVIAIPTVSVGVAIFSALSKMLRQAQHD